MSPSPNDLFLTIAAQDGSVFTTDRAAGSGAWSSFQPVPSLVQPGRKNLAVTATFRRQVCALNDAPIRQLRYTRDSGAWSAAVRLAAGIAPAGVESGEGTLTFALLGAGAPTQPGWSFGLPLFLVETDEKTVQLKGDQAASVNQGDLDPAESPVSLDIAGTFSDAARRYHLCLAMASGKTFYTFHDHSAPVRFAFEAIPPLKTWKARSITCAPGREGLHVCAVTEEGKILHGIRRPDGTWSGTGDVTAATRSTDLFQQVAISYYTAPGRGGVLHLAGVTRTGGLLHTMRTAEETADPLWSPFVDVKAQAGDRGPVASVAIGVVP